jgi:hypothetical protein
LGRFALQARTSNLEKRNYTYHKIYSKWNKSSSEEILPICSAPQVHEQTDFCPTDCNILEIFYPFYNKSNITLLTVYVTYRVSQEECARFRESISYIKVHRYKSKHLYPKLNGYGDNGQRKVRFHLLYLLIWRVTRTLRMSVLESGMQWTLRLPCKVLGTLRATTVLVRVFT